MITDLLIGWAGLSLLALPVALVLGRAAAIGDRMIEEEPRLHLKAILPRQRLGDTRALCLKPTRVTADRGARTVSRQRA